MSGEPDFSTVPTRCTSGTHEPTVALTAILMLCARGCAFHAANAADNSE